MATCILWNDFCGDSTLESTDESFLLSGEVMGMPNALVFSSDLIRFSGEENDGITGGDFTDFSGDYGNTLFSGNGIIGERTNTDFSGDDK